MRAVLQRVSSASVVVNGGDPRTIGPGPLSPSWQPNAPGCAFLPMMRVS